MQYKNQHITYCTNIHSGESWPDHFAELKKHFPEVKKSIAPDQPMGLGLRLSNQASLEILEGNKLDEFKSWLKENNAYVFTMNGFPYGAFHQQVVKDKVHHPDWTTGDRLDYTLRLFDILTALLPEGMDGGISTSPLSYRYWFKDEAEKAAAFKESTKNMLIVAERLAEIKRRTGKLLHLDIEPEPDGLLESGPEFIDWYENHLLASAPEYFAGRMDSAMVKEHICLCYDVCHFAVGFEDHKNMVKQLREKGIKSGKIQISAALRVFLPADKSERSRVSETLAGYNEPVYLHQVVAHLKNNSLQRFRDLSDALPELSNEEMDEWRIHFHVPIFAQEFSGVHSTQADISAVLDIQNEQPFTNHLEVETYTWEVLPAELKLPIAQSVSRELSWLLQYLRETN